jgi:DNA topoisomerase IB
LNTEIPPAITSTIPRRRLGRDLAVKPAARATSTAKAASSTELSRARARLLGTAARPRLLPIGSEDYAERNESYGLTTILKRHVSIVDREVIFDYVAKSGDDKGRLSHHDRG